MALRSFSRLMHVPRRSMTIIATTKTPADTTGIAFPAPPMVSAQREVLMEIYKERMFWKDPESILNYTEDDFAKADAEFAKYESKVREEVMTEYPADMQKEALESLIPTHPWKRMEKLNGKTLKAAFPHLFA